MLALITYPIAQKLRLRHWSPGTSAVFAPADRSSGDRRSIPMKPALHILVLLLTFARWHSAHSETTRAEQGLDLRNSTLNVLANLDAIHEINAPFPINPA